MEIPNLAYLKQSVVTPLWIWTENNSRAVREFRVREGVGGQMQHAKTTEWLGFESCFRSLSSEKALTPRSGQLRNCSHFRSSGWERTERSAVEIEEAPLYVMSWFG